MARSTLLLPPERFENRIAELGENTSLDRASVRLLLQVELALELMFFLRLEDEPVTAPWVLLSGIAIRHVRMQSLSPTDRRAIANTRQIVPFSAKFSWIDALRTYRELPEEWRNYNLRAENGEELELSERIISNQREVRQPIHQNIYEECLSARLDYRERDLKEVNAKDTYEFKVETAESTVTLAVQFSKKQLSNAQPYSTGWFVDRGSTKPLSIHLLDLAAEAIYLDEIEETLARHYSWPAEKRGNWLRRYRSINFRQVSEDGVLQESVDECDTDSEIDEALTLTADGFLHIAGMVGSGKSTLILLMVVYLLRHHPEQRTTLVVGDVQSAIRLADQINYWFCSDVERDTPVAVPIFGKSQQQKNLQNFLSSKDYTDRKDSTQTHWGERWLQTACPLQSVLTSREREKLPNGQPLVPGQEPCHSLRRTRKAKGKKKKPSKACYGCPFFATCPSKQLYRDLPTASVWITTSGGMAMGGLPHQLERRIIKVGELVYEQSDHVVFDEVETVSQWFDGVYAQPISLVNGKDGIFDYVSVPTEEYMRENRVPPSLTQRWTGAERDALKVITATLTMLDEVQGRQFLRKWVSRGYFTPYILMFRLSRRLAGLLEFDQPSDSEEQRTENLRVTSGIMSYFEALISSRLLETTQNMPEQTVRLSAIVQKINSIGESAFVRSIHRECVAWLEDFFPNIESQLSQLRTHMRRQQDAREDDESIEDKVDTIETLAARLQFALTLYLLDSHTRIVLYEWQNSPPTVGSNDSLRRMPSAMMDILALPPTGRQFGTYYAPTVTKSESTQGSNVLSLFAYTNVGRRYVLNFHKLLTDLDGFRGPNVLALSGTSYLPESTQFHLEEPPRAVLLPEARANAAIAQSTFEFVPQYKDDKPLRISGKPEKQKEGLFREVARSLVQTEGSLRQTLEELGQLGIENASHWQNRARILVLVNSYSQARWAADELHKCWSQERGTIYHLARNSELEIDRTEPITSSEHKSNPIYRSDIETFAQTGGRILVAPLSAIGRGFNILNRENKAAFGAVYFLTRPYPHPHDAQAIAQEMNRRATDWVKDAGFSAWEEDGITQRAEALRRISRSYWRSVEQRSYYKTLIDDDDREENEETFGAYPRKDLAATTVGLIIQAAGRLLRGGVPFKAYFVDAAWAPKSAWPDGEEPDTERTSLLVAMILRLCDYASEPSTVGHALYRPLADALENTEGLRW